MEIRRFNYDDAEECSELTIECLREVNIKDYPHRVIEQLVETYPPERFLKESDSGVVIVAEDNGRVIGTADLTNEGKIQNVFVDVKYQGKGIGTKLMQRIEQEAKQLGIKKGFLWSALGAVRFYEKLGYVEVLREDKGDYGIQVKMEKEIN